MMTAHPQVSPFEVFARHGKESAVHHVGTVRAADMDDAEVFAYTLYNERKWVAMFVCPREALVPVVEPQ